jgi:hypothetical protein
MNDLKMSLFRKTKKCEHSWLLKFKINILFYDNSVALRQMKFSTVKDYGHTGLIVIITFFNGLSVRGDGGMFRTLKWMQYLQSQRGNITFCMLRDLHRMNIFSLLSTIESRLIKSPVCLSVFYPLITLQPLDRFS